MIDNAEYATNKSINNSIENMHFQYVDLGFPNWKKS